MLSTLDLSHCSIGDWETVLSFLRSLPSLKALYLQGNPFWEEPLSFPNSSKVLGSRLAVLAASPLCTYLNDSPVFGHERAAADAWRESGGSASAAREAREAFLESAAREAERTARLLERPPRFLRLAEEEGGDEEPEGFSCDDHERECECPRNGDEKRAVGEAAAAAVMEVDEEEKEAEA